MPQRHYSTPLQPEDVAPDGALDTDQQARVDALTPAQLEEIDRAVLSCAGRRFHKVAAIASSAQAQLAPRMPDVPIRFYAMRIAHMVERGELEAYGDLERMRWSEVRR